VTAPALTRIARAVLPASARRWLRRAAREAPLRLRDLPKDAICVFAPRAFGGPLPPPGLRARVGLPSRSEFTLVGREGARQVLAAVARETGAGTHDWLDFGCGCGRLARPLLESGVPRSYNGVDVDARQVAWAARRLTGRFRLMRPEPPLAFPDGSFDVVLAVSIFTHLSEAEQFAWLAEIQRLLKPGGLLVATTHSETLADSCASAGLPELADLDARGFLHFDSPRFNDRASFHSREYLARAWQPWLDLRQFLPRGFVGYQDLTVWRARPREGRPLPRPGA
jgi:SAM-dependent methyltransferase